MGQAVHTQLPYHAPTHIGVIEEPYVGPNRRVAFILGAGTERPVGLLPASSCPMQFIVLNSKVWWLLQGDPYGRNNNRSGVSPEPQRLQS